MDWDRLSALVAWDEKALAPVLAIAAVTIGFIVYYFVMSSGKLEGRFLKHYGAEDGQANWIIFSPACSCLSFSSTPLPQILA